MADAARPDFLTLSLHDALPISDRRLQGGQVRPDPDGRDRRHVRLPRLPLRRAAGGGDGPLDLRSEEHTSELQSRGQLVCRLLLETKKRKWTASTTMNKSSSTPT